MSSDSESQKQEEELDALLSYLKSARGFDFTGYKRASLSRRLMKRMQMVSVATFADYLDYLQVHPDEFASLFNMLLINVTSFFRDEAAWESLQTHVAGLIARRPANAPIRVWCAGCASGEEPYSLAMVFAEAMGADELLQRVKIYATDLDEDALNVARRAAYSAKAVENLPEAMLEKYFSRAGEIFTFHKDLRRAVIFGAHDLAHDAPISRVDLLSCRNTLMYFNSETQKRILSRFHFALAEDGILFLAKRRCSSRIPISSAPST